MKLNVTYKLTDLLNALSAASDYSGNFPDIYRDMMRVGDHDRVVTVFEPANMLTTSPYARVTLTKREGLDTWLGYMETCAFNDGPRVPVAVNRSRYKVHANEDYTHFVLELE